MFFVAKSGGCNSHFVRVLFGMWERCKSCNFRANLILLNVVAFDENFVKSEGN